MSLHNQCEYNCGGTGCGAPIRCIKQPIIKHEPPKYWGYNNKYFAKITKCLSCANTGLFGDCRPSDPCKHCGGEVVEYGAGRWHPPVYSGFLFWKKEINPGYWEIKNEAHINRFKRSGNLFHDA